MNPWLPTSRRELLLAVLPVVPFVVYATVFTTAGLIDVPPTGSPAVVAPLGVALLALQVRHSLGAARGRVPGGGPWTLALLTALVLVPLPFLGLNWVITICLPIASVSMVLRGIPRALGLAALLAVVFLPVVITSAGPDPSPHELFVVTVYWFCCLVVAAGIVTGPRLVRLLDELDRTSAALAESGEEQERLRVARDVHDVLGQTLSAMSIKSDLAARLLTRNRGTDLDAAERHVQEIARLARDSLGSMIAVTRQEHRVDLATELEGARALLRAAGVAYSGPVMSPPLPPGLDEVFGWAVREAVTNLLLHSRAGVCRVEFDEFAGGIALLVENDGVGRRPGAAGTGLRGLGDRCAAVGGEVTTSRSGERFTLRVHLPLQVGAS